MERRRIIINFKNTPEDIALYEQIKNHSSISGYVKDIMKGLVKEKSADGTKTAQNNNPSTDIDDSINDILNGV